MTPRAGLYVGLVGLVMTVLCGIVALLMTNLSSGPPESWPDYALPVAFLSYFGLFTGFILMLVGLAGAVFGAMKKPS